MYYVIQCLTADESDDGKFLKLNSAAQCTATANMDPLDLALKAVVTIYDFVKVADGMQVITDLDRKISRYMNRLETSETLFVYWRQQLSHCTAPEKLMQQKISVVFDVIHGVG